jgi:hypothetical protein
LNNEWDFLYHLHGAGRARAEQWVAENFDHLGKTSTVDLEAKYFLSRVTPWCHAARLPPRLVPDSRR